MVRLHISHVSSHAAVWQGPLDPTENCSKHSYVVMNICSIVMKQNLRDNWVRKGLIRVGWKEPGNAGGTFLCCFELHTAVSNDSPVYFADTIDNRVQNCHKKSWAITSLHCINLGIFFFPKNLYVPISISLLNMTMSISLLNFFFCCFSKYELEDISKSMKLFYLNSGL